MKVQDIKKECTAIAGVSVEFSNSEVDTIVRLLWGLDRKIDKTVHEVSHALGQPLDVETGDDVYIDRIPLKVLMRVRWLLNKITNNKAYNTSDLFNQADAEHKEKIDIVNGGE